MHELLQSVTNLCIEMPYHSICRQVDARNSVSYCWEFSHWIKIKYINSFKSFRNKTYRTFILNFNKTHTINSFKNLTSNRRNCTNYEILSITSPTNARSLVIPWQGWFFILYEFKFHKDLAHFKWCVYLNTCTVYL